MTTPIRLPRTKQLRRLAITALVTTVLSLIGASPAMAYAPVNIVHTERVQAGPYPVTIGFSTWPIRAMQSVDYTFMPDGGITGKTGSLLLDGPGVKSDEHVRPLVHHPRKPDSWGLDVKALNAPGTYTFGFAIDGPQGHGQGTLNGVQVLNQPGPPLALSWFVGTLPFIGLLHFPNAGVTNAGPLLTVLGLVVMMNVVNFSDGVDGLAAGVCVIIAATMAIIAFSYLGRGQPGVLAAITAGAALGFLIFNFPPASSFMGDTGSNLLGFLLATASVQGALKTNAVIALAFPLIVLAVPTLILRYEKRLLAQADRALPGPQSSPPA